MAGNTEILIKRSLFSLGPGAAKQGELAYSYVSNTLFIGTPHSDGAIEIAAWSDLSGLTPGVYGDTTHIPTITVDSHGKVIAISNNTISTTLNFHDTLGGTGSVNLRTDSLDFAGTSGITTAASGNTVTIGVDNTIVRANTPGYNQTIDGILNITGDVNVTGNISYTDTSTVIAQNSLIFLANNNTLSDVIDIGFVGQSNSGSGITYTGLFRHAGDAGKDYYLFDNYTVDPMGTFVINPYTDGFTVSTLHANLVATTVYGNAFFAAEGEPDGSGNAGYTFQGDGGYDTGLFSRGDGYVELWSNAVKILEGYRDVGLQLQNGTTIVDTNSQSLAFGYQTVPSNYPESIAIGYRTNNDGGQQWQAVAIGAYAGYSNQGGSSIAIGARAGQNNQQQDSIAIGRHAGDSTQGAYSVALGYYAGQNQQLQAAVAIGEYAGNYQQNYQAVAVGSYAGYSLQGWSAVAVGKNAGEYSQGRVATAVGPSAGEQYQGQGATALGRMAGYSYQGQDAVALGHYAGYAGQGTNAIAIGNFAGYSSQSPNSIVLNASGSILNASESGLFINPVRYTENQDATYDGLMFYNASTNEVRYSYLLDGGNF